MRIRKAPAVLLAAVLTLGLGGAACGGADDIDGGGDTTTGDGNLRDSGEQDLPSEGGDTGDATNDDSAPVGGTGGGSESGGGTQTGP